MKTRLSAIRAALSARNPRQTPAPNLAAVAAILRDVGNSTQILLIRRAKSEHDPWSGHMAFPGGRQEPQDVSLQQTAERETLEEIGLDLQAHAELLGQLDDVAAIARGKRLPLTIRPFVFGLGDTEIPSFQPDRREVDEVLWLPFDGLLTGAHDSHYDYRSEGATLRLPAYSVQGNVIWGLTYQMLGALFGHVREHMGI